MFERNGFSWNAVGGQQVLTLEVGAEMDAGFGTKMRRHQTHSRVSKDAVCSVTYKMKKVRSGWWDWDFESIEVATY